MTNPRLLRPTAIVFIASALLTTGAWCRAQRAPIEPERIVGVETCRDCHGSIGKSWEQSAHATSFARLATTEAAQRMAKAIGIKSEDIATSESCIRCHFTQEKQSGGVQATAGVSCESCHGGGERWIEIHNNKSLTRTERVEKALSLGMRHPESVFNMAHSCYECHVVDDEALVNKAGHAALSDNFELLSWYSGEVKHNFLVAREGKPVKSNSNDPQPIPAARKRMLFLTGKLLHLSHSLEAISRSTDAPVDKNGNFLRLPDGRYTYAVQHAQSVRNLIEEIRDLQAILKIPEFGQSVTIASGLKLTTGHSEEIANAANEITRLAEQFSKKHDGTKFAALDAQLAKLLPKSSDHRTALGNKGTKAEGQ